MLTDDDSPPDADPKLLAMANAALVEQLQQVTAERDEARAGAASAADALTEMIGRVEDPDYDYDVDDMHTAARRVLAALRKLAGA